jgi:Ser/Thr protein kinase RdoA (MazF antagonist)
MKGFYELTNRGRALRLRRLAFAALEHYDLDVGRVRLVTNDFNGIFRVDTGDGQRYILRICLPEGGHTLAEIRSEMMWLAALRRDTDLGVPEPLATCEGTLVTTVEAPGVPEARHCVVFGWMPGPDLAEKLTTDNVRKLGELAAQLHQHASGFRPPEGFRLKTRDRIFPFGEPEVLFEDDHRPLYAPGGREVFGLAMRRVQAELDHLYADERGLHVIHNDLHQWNVKVFHGKIYALDFEDLMWGYPVQDIAVTLYYLQGYAAYPALREAFQQGYTLYRDWPEQRPKQIDLLIASRGLELANFVLQDPHPQWRQQAPEFLKRTEARLRLLLDID